MQWNAKLPPLYYDNVGNPLSENLPLKQIQQRCKFVVQGMVDTVLMCGSQEYMMFEFIDPDTKQADRAPAQVLKLRFADDGQVSLKLAWLRMDHQLQGVPLTMSDLKLFNEDSWLPLESYRAHLRDMSFDEMTTQMPNYVRVLAELQRIQQLTPEYKHRVHNWQRRFILDKMFTCNALQDILELYYAHDDMWNVPLGNYLWCMFLKPNFPEHAKSEDCKALCTSIVDKSRPKLAFVHGETTGCISCQSMSTPLCTKCIQHKHIIRKICRVIRHLRDDENFSRLTAHRFIVSLNDLTPTSKIFDITQTRSQTRYLKLC